MLQATQVRTSIQEMRVDILERGPDTGTKGPATRVGRQRPGRLCDRARGPRGTVVFTYAPRESDARRLPDRAEKYRNAAWTPAASGCV